MNKLKLYNTLSRKLENFRPISPDLVKIYTCGPTVYSAPHVGNLAAYVYWDLLIATLELNGYAVRRVLNLTDVGHLTSDADDGEDKLEKGARATGETVWEVADHFIQLFQDDFRILRLREPAVWARATNYIPEDEALVDTLTEKGYTYETRDGIYYDTAKFQRYADFARLDLAGLKAGARVAFSKEKHNPTDFAVWKFIQPGENHAMRWDYLGRPGYPGWHLECSTIIHTELGETIDIHTGGIDHIPVHHTNEIAQSEAAFERTLSRFWLHCNHLTTNGRKISKSLMNVYTLRDLAERGFDAMDFKLWVLQGHYQSERDFNFDDLGAARSRRLAWRNRAAAAYQRVLNHRAAPDGAVAAPPRQDLENNHSPQKDLNDNSCTTEADNSSKSGSSIVLNESVNSSSANLSPAFQQNLSDELRTEAQNSVYQQAPRGLDKNLSSSSANFNPVLRQGLNDSQCTDTSSSSRQDLDNNFHTEAKNSDDQQVLRAPNKNVGSNSANTALRRDLDNDSPRAGSDSRHDLNCDRDIAMKNHGYGHSEALSAGMITMNDNSGLAENDSYVFWRALNDNLNSPAVFAAVDAVENDDYGFWQRVEAVFRLGLLDEFEEISQNRAICELFAARAAARAAKNWPESDRLRTELQEKFQLSVLDTPTGQVWQFS